MEARKSGMWGWLLQRITGFLLIIGMFVHYLRLHFFNHGELSTQIVSKQLTPGWVFFDICLLAVVIYHGFYGVLGIIHDYNPSQEAKQGLFYLSLAAGIILFIFGSFSLITFAGYSIV